jgi:hypothetical protein
LHPLKSAAFARRTPETVIAGERKSALYSQDADS